MDATQQHTGLGLSGPDAAVAGETSRISPQDVVALVELAGALLAAVQASVGLLATVEGVSADPRLSLASAVRMLEAPAQCLHAELVRLGLLRTTGAHA